MSSRKEESRYGPFVWTTILLSAALVCSALVYWNSRAVERDTLDKLARDIERLERRLEQFEEEVPELLRKAERVADERFNEEVPALLDAVRQADQESRTIIVPANHIEGSRWLFPDDQMYRRFDIPSRPRMISPGDQIVRPVETREAEK